MEHRPRGPSRGRGWPCAPLPFFLVLEPSVMGPITMEGESRAVFDVLYSIRMSGDRPDRASSDALSGCGVCAAAARRCVGGARSRRCELRAARCGGSRSREREIKRAER